MVRMIFLMILLIGYGNLYSIFNSREDALGTNITFLDIGIGDSTLVRSYGKTIFIDGGPEDNVLFKLGKYLEIGQVIDLVIITHFHADHYAGIFEILDRYDVGEIWLPDVCDYYNYMSIIAASEAKYRLIGREFALLPIARDVRLEAISSHLVDGCFMGEDANKSSLIVVLSQGDKRAIMMGDAYIEHEKELIRYFPELFRNVTILKAGHHCSKTSSSSEFLKHLAPSYVICSTGRDNTYGHPDPEVISSFEELEITYYLTYSDGDISFKL